MSGFTILITCEHAGNEVPQPYAPLFQNHDALLAGHRGLDLGALQVAKILAGTLRAPLLYSTITRLLVDTNRSAGHRNLFSALSRDLPPKQRAAILKEFHLPHRELARNLIASAIAEGKRILHLAIHSFTPVYNDITRRADIGLLYDSRRPEEQNFCRQWQEALAAARPDLRIRRNTPYRGASDGLATSFRKIHGGTGYLGIEVEINQRLLAFADGPGLVASLLLQALGACLGQGQPLPQTAEQGDEVVAIVDAHDRVIGQTDRRTMRRQRLPHRAAYILVTNGRGEVFVQKRTMSKDIYPGYFDIAAGGVVLADETYEASARRELAEELGVTGELEYLFDNYYSDEDNTVWGRVFRCRHEGPFTLQASEVASGEFVDPETILTGMARRVTPDGIAILETLKRQGNLPFTASPGR